MHRVLQTLLLSDNPWLRDPARLDAWLDGHVPRHFVPREVGRREAKNWSTSERAHLVIGPRQAGKSTVIWAHLRARGEPALYLDCEQRLVREWCRSAPVFLDELSQVVDEPVTLFFDEVQHLEEAGLFLKGLVDRHFGAPILVTGSSSYHLGSRTRESLAGRATRSRLLPFSLAEVCADLPAASPVARQRAIEERLARHIALGGYPQVWLADSPERPLADLVEAFALRDASDLFRIARPDAFRRLMRLLARQTGSLVNLSEWSSLLGISRDTVSSYLAILEETHIAVTLPPFAGGRRSELTGRPKVFLVDSGLRGHLVGDLRPLAERADRGPTLESWVFTELWKWLPPGSDLHFWRSTSGAEVDFVVSGPGRPLAVEVKAERLTRPRLPRAARSFVDAYHPERLLMVNRGLEHEAELGDTRLRWVTPAGLRAALDVSRRGYSARRPSTP